MSINHHWYSYLSDLAFIFVSIFFRKLQRDGFSSESSSTKPVDSIDSGKAAGKSESFMSSAVLIGSIGALQSVFSVYPNAELTFRDSIRAADLDKGVRGTDFQLKKERMLILLHLLKDYTGLEAQQLCSLCNAVFVDGDKQKTLGLLKSFAQKRMTNRRGVNRKGREALLSEEEMWRNAQRYATSLSDLRFLSYLKTIPPAHGLHDTAVECRKAAYVWLTTQLDSLASGISQAILSIQKGESDKRVNGEVKSEEEKELKVFRAEFVRQIDDLCRARSRL